VDEAVGQTIPEVAGADFDGTPVSIVNDGTPKAISFLAHWCPHCQAEVPEVQDWLETNEVPGDVQIISVATGINPNRTNYPSSEWLEGEGWTPPVIVDSQTGRVSSAYGLTGFPMWVFVDRDGNVVARTSGQSSIEAWEAMLNLLAQT
jgi:thiol-disulfide isomerase/thioredoxin